MTKSSGPSINPAHKKCGEEEGKGMSEIGIEDKQTIGSSR